MHTKIRKTTITRFFLFFVVILLSACSSSNIPFSQVQDAAPKYSVNINNIPNAKPRYLPKSRYGNPKSYVVNGHRYYVLNSAAGYRARGIASWYGTKFQGRLTSSRQPYNLFGMTAASPVLPIPTFVRVTNLANDRSVIVKVNDRGPFARNRIIDLSYVAAEKLGYAKRGTALVEVDAINIRNPNATPRPVLAKNPQLYLQIGAFQNFNNAERLKAHVSTLTNRRVVIRRGLFHSKTIYRVQIGPLIGVGESDRLYSRLEGEGLKPFTVVG